LAWLLLLAGWPACQHFWLI